MTDISLAVKTFFDTFPRQSFSKGEILIQAEENPGTVFYIVEGRVSQYDVAKNGNEIIVNAFNPGAFFPMSSAINTSMPNHYFFEAATPLVAYVAPATDVVNFLEENPKVLFDLLARVYRGTDGVLRRMAHLMGGNAASRLLFELLNASCRFSEHQPDGTLRITLKESDLAKHSGLTRETVNRVLQSLKKERLVTVNKQGIFLSSIADIEARLGNEI